MSISYACNVAGAVFNLLCCDDYGRREFLCRQFGISRSTLYRKSTDFIENICNEGGRPVTPPEQIRIKELEDQLHAAEVKITELRDEREKKLHWYNDSISKLEFMLITTGLSGRLIAWILRASFGVRANHTDILRKAQEYAAKATVYMQKYFHCRGVVVAIDEVFVEGLPVFIAVAPESMLICNAGVYEECTEVNWTEFLDEMENLEQTISDRGTGIMAAVTKRLNNSHQSDIFHCKYTIRKALLKQEKQCYALIRAEEEAQIKLEKCKIAGKDARGAAARFRRAKEKCTAAIERFDSLEQAIKMGFDALSLSAGPVFNTAQQARHTLDFVCDWIQHIQPGWRKVISAFRDPHLLTYMDKAHSKMNGISVKANLLDREYILATMTRLWEEQAPRRWRGKEVIIPTVTMTDLERCCLNLGDVQKELFTVLESTPKASSSVECINSRVGFCRYSKNRFNDDFANLISIIHNLSPFMDGKRKGKSPVEIENVPMPTRDIFELFGVT